MPAARDHVYSNNKPVVGKRPTIVWDAILDHEPSTLGRETVIAEPVEHAAVEEGDEQIKYHNEYLSLRPAGYSVSSIV